MREKIIESSQSHVVKAIEHVEGEIGRTNQKNREAILLLRVRWIQAIEARHESLEKHLIVVLIVQIEISSLRIIWMLRSNGATEDQQQWRRERHLDQVSIMATSATAIPSSQIALSTTTLNPGRALVSVKFTSAVDIEALAFRNLYTANMDVFISHPGSSAQKVITNLVLMESAHCENDGQSSKLVVKTEVSTLKWLDYLLLHYIPHLRWFYFSLLSWSVLVFLSSLYLPKMIQ
jgi:hypothetical protein